jgi:hypothetical protein
VQAEKLPENMTHMCPEEPRLWSANVASKIPCPTFSSCEGTMEVAHAMTNAAIAIIDGPLAMDNLALVEEISRLL